VVLFRPVAALRNRSPAALRIKLAQDAEEARVEIVKCRGGRSGAVALRLDEGISVEVSSEVNE
jgi:hypothetical protein